MSGVALISSMTLYYAVNRSGQGCIFVGKPTRNEILGVWKGQIVGYVTMTIARMESSGSRLPDIGWLDNPIRLTLTLTHEI